MMLFFTGFIYSMDSDTKRFTIVNHHNKPVIIDYFDNNNDLFPQKLLIRATSRKTIMLDKRNAFIMASMISNNEIFSLTIHVANEKTGVVIKENEAYRDDRISWLFRLINFIS